ncbi:MAG: hypothetical protein ABI321_22180 [Polyangia bacterium]
MPALRHLALLLGLCATAGARADEPLLRYRNVQAGAVADFQLSSTSGGLAVLGEGGAQFVGIETFRQGRLLVQWDALLAVRGGVLGNTAPPFTTLIGGHTMASVEAGYRFMHASHSSLYLGARLSGDLSIMAHPGLSLSQLDRLNAMDSVGGVVAHGDVRVALGYSWLSGRKSLLLTGFVQEAGYIPGVFTPGLGYTEAGVSARFDLAQRLTLHVEGFAGRGAKRTEPSLDTDLQSSTAGIQALVRGVFDSGVWLALSGSYQRELDHRAYHTSHTVYDTANAPNMGFQLLVGLPFQWNHKHR